MNPATPILKVAVFADGRLTVNGSQVSIESLRESLRKLADARGAVLYYRESGQQNPPAIATQVINEVIAAGTLRLSSKPDYSDSIGPDGIPSEADR